MFTEQPVSAAAAPLFEEEISGRGVGAGAHPEVAHHRDDAAALRGPRPCSEGGVAPDRVGSLVRATLSRDPPWVGMKKNNGRFWCLGHDCQLLPGQPAQSMNNGYRFVIPECPADPEAKPHENMRIGHEFSPGR
ncbi:hypothetical protein [Mycobacterium parmense]|uniref:hypothetical protein n=1 Tax=Mycobacterium parmense TaxID=185642 RepID=UPI0013747E15|nr:hypothetical protein [Mycobacterium parmense]MCV7349410.1 hypothetical protein [Mycobacterium parmense]